MKPMYQLSAILLSIVLILSLSTKTYAKQTLGGCAVFGHSCYGGHGKRSDPQISSDDNQFSLNPFRSDPNKELRADMNEIEQPVNIGDDFYENQEKVFRYAVYNVMRQMIENSRRNNQNNVEIPEKITAK